MRTDGLGDFVGWAIVMITNVVLYSTQKCIYD